MFNLTPQEKLILIFVSIIAICGIGLDYYRKNYPQRAAALDTFIEKNIIKKTKLLNINAASREELMDIPSIGKKTAQKIIDYRKNYGSFSSLDELKNIKGISENRLKKIKDYLTIE